MKKVLATLSLLMVIGVSAVFAQTRTITGKVTGSEDGEPIPGATVFVMGTTVGTVTQFDGTYSLNVPTEAETLVFSFIGMKAREESISGRTTINAVLELDAIQVEEVVVTALGIRRERKALGYAVQDVASEELT